MRIVELTYSGPREFVEVAELELRESNFEVEVDWPLNKSAGAVPEMVVVYLSLKIGDHVLDDAIDAAIAKVRDALSRRTDKAEITRFDEGPDRNETGD